MNRPLRRRIAGLDGVRGLAIIAVLLFHNFGIPGGWVGVDLFFVLSGFLITRILISAKGSKDYFRSFYVRRSLRIFPPYYALLAISYCVTAMPMAQMLWHAGYLADFKFLNPNTPFLDHTWSLAVEEQFYLVWPIVVLAASTRRLKFIALGGLAIPLFARCLALSSEGGIAFANFNILARCDGLLVGSALACFEDEGTLRLNAGRQWSWSLLLLSAIVVFGLASTGYFSVSNNPTLTMYTLGYAAVTGGCAALVWIAVASERESLPQRLLTATPGLVALGHISYGVYLFHFPILYYGQQLYPSRDPLTVIPLGVATTVAAVLLAMLSWKYFEQPILELKERLAPRH